MAKRFVTHHLELGQLAIGDCFKMPKDIEHHVLGVMRLRNGQVIELVDARGVVALASLASDGELRVDALDLTPPKKACFELELRVALIKWPRFEWMLEKACELGVRRVLPLLCERSVVRPSDWTSKALRLNRIVQQASRQSLNRIATEILTPKKLDATLLTDGDSLCLYAHFGEHPNFYEAFKTAQKPASFVVFIGPEGGFSPNELAFLESTARPISLGATTLRTETAAIAVAASLAIFL